MSAQTDLSRQVTIRELQRKKQAGEKIVCLTAYDASFAHLLDRAGVDVVLVGDSLGMVVQGKETTLPVEMSEMLYHTRCVARGLQRSLLMADMPFLSFTSVEQALIHAGQLLKQSGAQMVKLEGGGDQLEIVQALTSQGIPVCAHLGLQPQRIHKIGGYRVQGRDQDAARQMLDDALALEQAGADLMLLECVPQALAAEITQKLQIPVIGIGAGVGCDGQILVLYDILDISFGMRPKFSKNFMFEAGSIEDAIKLYVDAVLTGAFPTPEHSFQS